MYGTLWNGAGSGLLISVLEKLNLFCLTSHFETILRVTETLCSLRLVLEGKTGKGVHESS